MAKKILVVVFTAVLAFGAVACGGEEDDDFTSAAQA